MTKTFGLHRRRRKVLEYCGGGGGGGEGGARFRILEGQEGPNSQQAHDVVTTSMRIADVASTSFRRYVPTRFE